ncbi:MAG: pyrroline-5-carboxylate reductase [Bacteroidetes bacterium]|nr:MAG: pyrroline-5-carboxylate reductase [Bacteroidota bacterium]
MKILIVGGGNMGKTYADSFIDNYSVSKDDLYILEKLEEKVEYFKSIGFQNVFFKPDSYISEMDLIILAIKPQDTSIVFPLIADYITENQVVLSIMAGVKMVNIEQALPKAKKIIRAMPNLPAQVGMGMTGFTSAKSVSKEEVFMVHNLLNTTGKCLYFDDESKLDAVTAISGSGPAYVYFFMDSMIETAMQMGFSKVQAELLVEQTFLGAVHLQNTSKLTCKEWISRVASKGGTTEAALKKFTELDLAKGIGEGLHDAHKRAVELGK